MSSNTTQRSVIWVLLFALIMLLILYSSNSGNEVFHYTALRARFQRPTNLKKWGITESYVPVSGNKGEVPLLAEHRLVHYGDCSGAL
uniref:ST6 N-acetylgalactosaminide alpha-2,6-sialyltransferase 6 n=1 Tax=Ornithorhynchus anatinus TaxID=9258 RepID=A0A6I8P490_ORNAN